MNNYNFRNNNSLQKNGDIHTNVNQGGYSNGLIGMGDIVSELNHSKDIQTSIDTYYPEYTNDVFFNPSVAPTNNPQFTFYNQPQNGIGVTQPMVVDATPLLNELEKDYNRVRRDNVRLGTKLTNILKADVQRNEKLVSHDGCLYKRTEKSEGNPSEIKFANFDIVDIEVVTLEPQSGKEFCINLTISNGVNICLSDNEFATNKIVAKLVKSSLSFESGINNKQKGELLYNYIAELIFKNKDKITFQPYNSGWYEGEYIFPERNELLKGSPRFSDEFRTSGTNEPAHSCRQAADGYTVFKQERLRVGMLALVTASVIYTLLKPLDLAIDKIALINLGSNTTLLADMFLKLFNKGGGNISIAQNSEVVNKSMYGTKDRLNVIDARVFDITTGYLPPKNMNAFISVYGNGNYIDTSLLANEDIRLVAESPIALLFNGMILPENDYYYLNFEADECDIDSQKLYKLAASKYTLFWGDMFKYFIEYISEKGVAYKFVEPLNIESGKRNSYRSLNLSLELFSDFFKSIGLELDECLELSRNHKELLHEFVYKSSFNNDMVEKFKDTLKWFVDNRYIKPVFGNMLPEKEEIYDKVLVLEDKLLITESSVSTVVEAMHTDISREKLLKYLKAHDYIVTNDGNRYRKTVYIGNESCYQGFVAFRREYFDVIEAPKEAENKEENSDEKRFDNWAKLQ
jgi:hypothetical protein